VGYLYPRWGIGAGARAIDLIGSASASGGHKYSAVHRTGAASASGGHKYSAVHRTVGLAPFHWLSWIFTDPGIGSRRVSLGCHGLSPEGKKGRRGRDSRDLASRASADRVDGWGGGRSTRLQRDPRTDMTSFVQRDPAVCRHAATTTRTRTLTRTHTQPNGLVACLIFCPQEQAH
jgi:hypothetical protein